MKPIIIVLALLFLQKLLFTKRNLMDKDIHTKKINAKDVKRLSDEHRVLFSIFKGANPKKHPQGYLIAEKDDEIEKEITLIKLLMGVWHDYPAMLTGLRLRLKELEKTKVLSSMVKTKDTLNPYTGGTIDWEIKQPDENTNHPAE